MKTLGLDWGHREHAIAVLDSSGRWLAVERISARDAGRLCELLASFGGPGEVRVALEAGAPLLCPTLAAHGYVVEQITPGRAQKARELLFPGGAKDDARDARVLAWAAHPQGLDLKGRRPPQERAEGLRALTRMRGRCVGDRTRAIQRLVDLLRHHHPGLAALDLDFTCGYAVALVRAFADPLRARAARVSRIARILRQGRARRIDAQQVRQHLRGHGFEIPDHLARICAIEARLLADRIALGTVQIKQVEVAIAQHYADHPDAELLRSLPGCGPQLSPRISARIDGVVVRQVDANKLQVLAGTAPRTRVSGKRHGGSVRRRTACDHELHQALVQLAKCSVKQSDWARHFVRHHTSGHVRDRERLNRAYRALANKWVRIIHAVLTARQPYDEQFHAEHLRRQGVVWAPPNKEAA